MACVVVDPGKRYEMAVEEVKRILDDADPMGLLAMGAPQDEYDSQAREVARRHLHGERMSEGWVQATWPEWSGGQRLRLVGRTAGCPSGDASPPSVGVDFGPWAPSAPGSLLRHQWPGAATGRSGMLRGWTTPSKWSATI